MIKKGHNDLKKGWCKKGHNYDEKGHNDDIMDITIKKGCRDD